MSHHFGNNNLLSGFQNFQKNNIPFQNNNLLNNNPMFQNSMKFNNSQQIREMQEMQQRMAKLRQLQQLKQAERLHEFESVMDIDKIRESVIKPLKEAKVAKEEFNNAWIARQNEFKPERDNLWKSRTNQPYKNILKNVDYTVFFEKKHREDGINEDALIVHKVTDADKLQERLLKELKELTDMQEEHDNELKIIYSLSNRASHKEKFNYIHINKYEKIKYDPSDFNDMKKDKIELFKKEQQKIEKDKKKIDDIIENLVNKGMISEQDAKDMYEYDKVSRAKQSDSDLCEKDKNALDDIDLDNMADLEKLEQRLMAELSEDDIKLLENETGIKSKPKAKLIKQDVDENKLESKSAAKLIKKQNDDESKPRARLIKKQNNDESIQSGHEVTFQIPVDENKPKARLVKKQNEQVGVTTEISESIKNKYKQRQKQHN